MSKNIYYKTNLIQIVGSTHLKREDLDLKLTKDMKTAMIKNLTDRYVQGALMFLNITPFVDPRFKSPSFLTDDEKQLLLEFVEQEVIDNKPVTAKKDATEEQLNPPKKKL